MGFEVEGVHRFDDGQAGFLNREGQGGGQACQQGHRARFFTVTGLEPQLQERREQKELERFHKQLEGLELLVLDELGYVRCSKAGAELLFEVVSRAYERTSLIVTTNLPF